MENVERFLDPRVLQLIEADKQGRVVILPTSVQVQREGVERALDIKLYDWQVAFIWGDSNYLMPGRATGKTLATMIRLCVERGVPLVFNRYGIRVKGGDYLRRWYHEHDYWWAREVERIYNLLKMYEVPGLREISFREEETRLSIM